MLKQFTVTLAAVGLGLTLSACGSHHAADTQASCTTITSTTENGVQLQKSCDGGSQPIDGLQSQTLTSKLNSTLMKTITTSAEVKGVSGTNTALTVTVDSGGCIGSSNVYDTPKGRVNGCGQVVVNPTMSLSEASQKVCEVARTLGGFTSITVVHVSGTIEAVYGAKYEHEAAGASRGCVVAAGADNAPTVVAMSPPVTPSFPKQDSYTSRY